MLRLLGKAFFWGVVFTANWWAITVATGRAHGAFFAVVTTTLFAVVWSKVIGPWYGRGTEELRQKNRRERLAREAHAHAVAERFDEAIMAARQGGYVPRSAFDAETQRAIGHSRYHTHYISPEQQRWMEEWFPDEEGNPSLKAGVYVFPIPVTGPERIDARPTKDQPLFIPVQRRG